MSSLLLNKKVDLDVLSAEAEGLVNLESYFPEMVFWNEQSIFRFVEFSNCFSRAFWNLLRTLGIAFGDSTINVLVQKPSQQEYVLWGGYFAAAQLPVQSTADDYCRVMAFEGEVRRFPALYYSALNLLWFGSSGTWGIYGDRDYNISAGGLSKHAEEIGLSWPKDLQLPWLGEEVVRQIILSNSSNDEPYRIRAEKLMETYRILE